jgi:hypothetical protein
MALDLSSHFSAHDDFPGFNIGRNTPVGPDGEFSGVQPNLPLHLAIDKKVVFADDFAFHDKEPGQVACRRSTQRRRGYGHGLIGRGAL